MKVLVYVFFMLPVVSLGQRVSIDFEHSDLTGWLQSDSGHWCITDVDVISGNYSLKHCYDDEIAGFDWVTFFYQPIDLNNGIIRWDFTIRYNVDPSSNNNWSVFLNDNCLPDNEGKLRDGIVIGVNYEGNSDEIMVWETHNGEIVCLLNTGFNWERNIATGKNVRFSIIGSQEEFGIRIDTATGNSLMLGSFRPENHRACNAFTLFYKYSATYDRKLWFDDLIIEAEFIEDTIPPTLAYYSFVNEQTLDIGFSEPVRIQPNAVWCIDGTGCGTSQNAVASAFELVFPNPMMPGYSYFLELPELSDVYDNKPGSALSPVELYFPDAYDIVISEILADPSPLVLLPETEYVELFNAGDKVICLKDWQFSANTRKTKLPCINLLPESYLLLYDPDTMPQFDPHLNVLGLHDLPALANSGARLLLQDRSGKLIHAVIYKDDWYASTDKKDGGWSLEMINPWDACSGDDNWKESEDHRGGTPAEENSVFSIKTINTSPELWRAAITVTGSLMLYFSEPIDSTSVSSINYYTVNRNIGHPVQVIPAWPLADRVELFFSRWFETETEYTVSLSADICDCSRNQIVQPARSTFSVSEVADSADIVINEILFDPETDRIEFIELFNASQKTIDLKEFQLVLNERNDTGNIITTDYWPLESGGYCLIASGFRDINSSGRFQEAEKIIYMPDMPRLSNEGNTLFLRSTEGQVMDKAGYSPDWHHEILAETKGISLERISPYRSGLERLNWQSAASDAGYMTPAAPNSQQAGENLKCEVTMEPETITPDADGSDEELSICYRLDEDGYMGRILIFDVDGRRCRILANGALLGVTGCHTFDGRNDAGHILSTGYYILYFEAYHENGNHYVKKKAFVVAH